MSKEEDWLIQGNWGYAVIKDDAIWIPDRLERLFHDSCDRCFSFCRLAEKEESNEKK